MRRGLEMNNVSQYSQAPLAQWLERLPPEEEVVRIHSNITIIIE